MHLEKMKTVVILCLFLLVFNNLFAQLGTERITQDQRKWICQKDHFTNEHELSVFIDNIGDFCEKLTDRCSDAYMSLDTCFDLRFQSWLISAQNKPSWFGAQGERFVDSSSGFQKYTGSLDSDKVKSIDLVAKRYLQQIKQSDSSKLLCCNMYEDKDRCERDFSNMQIGFSTNQRLNRIHDSEMKLPLSDLINCQSNECVESSVLTGVLDYCTQRSGLFDIEERCEGSEFKLKEKLYQEGNTELNSCIAKVEQAFINSNARVRRKSGKCKKYTYYKLLLSMISLNTHKNVFIQKRNLCRNHFNVDHLRDIESINDISRESLVEKINALSDSDLVKDPLPSLLSQCLFENSVQKDNFIINQLCKSEEFCLDSQ